MTWPIACVSTPCVLLRMQLRPIGGWVVGQDACVQGGESSEGDPVFPSLLLELAEVCPRRPPQGRGPCWGHLESRIVEPIKEGNTQKSEPEQGPADRAQGLCQYVPQRTGTYPVRTADWQGAFWQKKNAPAGRLNGRFSRSSRVYLFVLGHENRFRRAQHL